MRLPQIIRWPLILLPQWVFPLRRLPASLYIFAIVCEELGLFGALLIILLFAVTIFRGYWIALQARDRFSTVLAAGLTTLIAIQTILNLGVVTNLLPSTGISLPFFSYGGTALAVNLGEMGIILSISRHRYDRKIQEVIL